MPGLSLKTRYTPPGRLTSSIPTVYALDELKTALESDNCLPNPSWRKTKRRYTTGLGRNCVIFDSARLWAYREVRNHFGNPESLEKAVTAHVHGLNAEFKDPLPEKEAQQIANSIVRWIVTESWLWNDGEAVYEATFTAIQSARGKKNKGISKTYKELPESRIAQLEEALTQQVTANETLETKFENLSSSMEHLEEQQKSNFEAQLETQGNEWKSLLERKETEYNSMLHHSEKALSAHEDEAFSILEKLKTIQEEVEAVAGNTASSALGRKFSEAAKKDQRAAFSLIILATLGTLAAVIYVIRGNPHSDLPPLQWVTAKITFTILVAGTVTALFSFAKKLLDNAQQVKRSELEIRVINPLLEDVKKDDLASETKVDFVKRSFGQRQSSDKEINSLLKTTDTEVERFTHILHLIRDISKNQ